MLVTVFGVTNCSARVRSGLQQMSESEKESGIVSYKPSVWYFRKALREAQTLQEARDVGLMLCRAYQYEREWIRKQGLIPPKHLYLEQEGADKGWDLTDWPHEDPNQISFPFEA